MSEKKVVHTRPQQTVRQKAAKKKKRKKLTPVVKLVCFIIIAFSCYLLYSVIKEIYTTIQLRNDLNEVNAELVNVQDENTYLTSQRDKLQDPDYVQSYARGNYMLTKNGEEIYYLPASEDK